eukprot:g5441.t1
MTVLNAALSSISETKQLVSAPNLSSSTSSSSRSRGKFKCGECGRLFSTKGNMMRHAQATHAREGVKMFPCEVCGRKFKRREDLVTHGRVHTGEKPYACRHKGCGKRFARISDQRSHERIHSSDAKRYECKHCGKRFTRPYDLKKHEMNIHRQERPATGKRKERGGGADILTAGTSSVSDGTARNGGSKRLRITGVEISGTIPGKNIQGGSACSSQPLPTVAGAAANGSVAVAVEQQFQEQAACASSPLPTKDNVATNGLIAAAVQQQQQQELQQTGQSSQPPQIVASAAAKESLATVVQEQQPQGQAAHSPQPLPTNATAAVDESVSTLEEQQRVIQEQYNQQWRKDYKAWQRRQQQLNNQQQPRPEQPGSLADSSLSTAGQGQQVLELPPLPPQPPVLAKAAAAAAQAAAAAAPNPKAAASPRRHLRRKRVRCDSHKHFDTAAGRERVNPPGGATMINLPRESATGGPTPSAGDDRRQEQNIMETFADAKTHVHGAKCGHVAVLHDSHIDFIVENGQLECFAGKERTPKLWVSTVKEGSGEGGCGCRDILTRTKADAAGNGNNNSSSDSNSSNSNGNTNDNSSSSCSKDNGDNAGNDKRSNSNYDISEINSDGSKDNGNKRDCCNGKSASKISNNDSNSTWKVVTRDELIQRDGARADQPRGNCTGDNHGPHCGHDVIHHNGHLDYVVNGRLIHPVQVGPPPADGNDNGTGSGGAAAPQMQYEDHGSIKALDEDFVTFWSSFSQLSEMADEEVLSFCDICASEDTADGANLSPVI